MNIEEIIEIKEAMADALAQLKVYQGQDAKVAAAHNRLKKQILKLEDKREYKDEIKCVKARKIMEGYNTPTIKKIHPFTYRGDATVVFEVETLNEGLTLIEKLNPEVLFLTRKGGTAFVPESDWDDKEDGEIYATEPYYLRIGGLKNDTDKILHAFIVVDDEDTYNGCFIIKVEVKLTKERDVYRTFNYREFKGGYEFINVKGVDNTGTFTKRFKMWSSPDVINEVVFHGV